MSKSNWYGLSHPVRLLSLKNSAAIISESFETIYCGCIYQGKTVTLDSGGMSEAKEKKRVNRIEIEHMLRRFGNRL
ncbi:hypothetical protein [Legionella rowbothamii]|uniref:hypothetical protein n=1 Tax=Legionella rowbothamii TaxID=96229 RepID=UPI001054469A|nr:hypothetical protein [Legionella rowbothamii]